MSSSSFTSGFTPEFEGELACARARFEHMRAAERLVLFYQNVRLQPQLHFHPVVFECLFVPLLFTARYRTATVRGLCDCNLFRVLWLQALAELSNGNGNGAAKDTDMLEVLQTSSNGDSSSCASSDALSAEFVKVDLDGGNGSGSGNGNGSGNGASGRAETAAGDQISLSKEASLPTAITTPPPWTRAQLLAVIERLKSILRTQWPSVRERLCACVTTRLTCKCVCTRAANALVHSYSYE